MTDQEPANGAAPGVGSPEPSPPSAAAEEQVWTGQPSLWARAGRVFGSLVVALLLAVTAGITAWVWLVWMNRLLIPALVIWAAFNGLYPRLANAYRLTSQRLFVRRGWLAHTTDQIELIRVDDIRARQGMIQRLLGLGDVIVLSTDVTDPLCVLHGVRTPDELAEKIREYTRQMRKKSLFVESL